jgi:hypothetical protein
VSSASKVLTRIEVEDRLRSALATLLDSDWWLLYVGASERSLCHKLAEILQRLFGSFKVDCEYNRDGEKPKSMPPIKYGPDRGVLPDIIVHERGADGSNLLVIEAKCTDHTEVERLEDEEKLRAIQKEFSYLFAVSLVFERSVKSKKISRLIVGYSFQKSGEAEPVKKIDRPLPRR